MDDALTERVEALERAVTGGEYDLSGLAAEGEALDRLEQAEAVCDDLEDRVAELEAATQALRGYVGNVRAINEEIEGRADAALAKAQALEQSLTDTHTRPENAEAVDARPPERAAAGSPREGAGETPVVAGTHPDDRTEPRATEPASRPGRVEMSSDGGVRRESSTQPATTQTESTVPRGRTAHCEQCGQPRTLDGSTNSNGSATNSTYQRGSEPEESVEFGADDRSLTESDPTDTDEGDDEEDPFEWLGDSDPLVDDESNGGRLSRFKELL